MLKENIKQLVAENKTDEVIDSLLSLSDKIKDENLKNSIVILSSRYKRFIDQNIRGVSDSEEENIYLSQLNAAILKLVDEIPDVYFSENHSPINKQATESQLDATLNKIIKIANIVLFLTSAAALIYCMFYYYNDNSVIDILQFLPFWASLTGLVTSGFFYYWGK